MPTGKPTGGGTFGCKQGKRSVSPAEHEAWGGYNSGPTRGHHVSRLPEEKSILRTKTRHGERLNADDVI